MEQLLNGSVSDIVVNDERNAIYANVTFENSSIKLYVCISRPTLASEFLLWIVDDNNPTFSYQECYNLRKGWEVRSLETSQEIYKNYIYTIRSKVFSNLLKILLGT